MVRLSPRVWLWFCAGLGACNAILGNENGQIATAGPDGGGGGVPGGVGSSSSSGTGPGSDAALPPVGDGGGSDAATGACACGVGDDGYCAPCARTPLTLEVDPSSIAATETRLFMLVGGSIHAAQLSNTGVPATVPIIDPENGERLPVGAVLLTAAPSSPSSPSELYALGGARAYRCGADGSSCAFDATAGGQIEVMIPARDGVLIGDRNDSATPIVLTMQFWGSDNRVSPTLLTMSLPNTTGALVAANSRHLFAFADGRVDVERAAYPDVANLGTITVSQFTKVMAAGDEHLLTAPCHADAYSQTGACVQSLVENGGGGVPVTAFKDVRVTSMYVDGVDVFVGATDTIDNVVKTFRCQLPALTCVYVGGKLISYTRNAKYQYLQLLSMTGENSIHVVPRTSLRP